MSELNRLNEEAVVNPQDRDNLSFKEKVENAIRTAKKPIKIAILVYSVLVVGCGIWLVLGGLLSFIASDLKDFSVALAATLVSSLGVFLLLVGIVNFLMGSFFFIASNLFFFCLNH